MQTIVRSSKNILIKKKIREFAATNPHVNEEDVAEALALFSEIAKARKDRTSQAGYRIAPPYGTSLISPKVDQCKPAPALRFTLD